MIEGRSPDLEHRFDVLGASLPGGTVELTGAPPRRQHVRHPIGLQVGIEALRFEAQLAGPDGRAANVRAIGYALVAPVLPGASALRDGRSIERAAATALTSPSAPDNRRWFAA